MEQAEVSAIRFSLPPRGAGLDPVEFPRQSEALRIGGENSKRKRREDIENHVGLISFSHRFRRFENQGVIGSYFIIMNRASCIVWQSILPQKGEEVLRPSGWTKQKCLHLMSCSLFEKSASGFSESSGFEK